MNGSSTHADTGTDVLVAGAGPSGLVTALELARHGVRVRVVDRKPGPVAQSRATIVHARSLEVLDRFGVADEAVKLGAPIVRVEVREKGRSAAVLPLADAGLEGRTRFPCALSLEQSQTERILAAALRGHGVEIDWNCAVRRVAGTAGGVEAVVRRDGGEETIRARWLVGADGAGSTVRKALGIPFTGTTYEQAGLLADVEVDLDLPADRLRLNLTRGGFVGVLPLGGDRYRLFGAVPPGFVPPSEDTAVSHESYSELPKERLQEWFDDYFAVEGTLRAVHWASLFRCHSRNAERYRSGHVFLVGDAAHVNNPAGGQGMNLGIGDGANLAWKLAAVINDEAGPELLDTYEYERRPVARTIMRNTDRGFRLETTSNPVAIWMRARFASKMIRLTTRLPPVRRTMFRMLSQTWIGYRASHPGTGRPGGKAPRSGGKPLRSGGKALRPGDRAPHAPTAEGGSVLDVLRTAGFHMLVFEGLGTSDPPAVEGLADACEVPVHVHVVRRSERAAHLTYVAHRARVVLLRPDGHLASPAAPFPVRKAK